MSSLQKGSGEIMDKFYKWLGVLGAILFFVIMLTLPSEPTGKRVIKAHSSEIVKVYPWGHKDAHGSGIILTSSGYVLTAGHIAALGGAFLIHTQDGRVYRAGLLGINKQLDIAILQPTSKIAGLNKALLASKNPEVGTPVVHIGNPIFFEWLASQGTVINYFDVEGTRCLISDAWAEHGSSGGALYNLQGKLVGLIVTMLLSTTFQSVSAYVPIETVNQFVSSWEDSYASN